MSPSSTAPRVLCVCVAALALIITAPHVAQAQGIGATGKQRVLLVPMQRGDEVSSVVPGRIFEYLQTILEMNAAIDISTLQTLRPPTKEEVIKAPETDATLVKADEALWAAKELVEKKAYKKAIKTYKKAMKGYEKRFAQLVDFDKYVDASLGVALAYFLSGYDDNGEDALAPVLALRPTLLLDKRKVPEPAIAALARLKHIGDNSAKGAVEVTANIAGAEVFIDGVRVGAAPYKADGLWRGRHVVRVLADGYEPFSKTFLASTRPQKVAAKMKADPTAGPPDAQPLPQTPDGLATIA